MSSTGILSINLTAIADNWQYLNRNVGASVACAAVVKANAYGLGVRPVVESLLAAGCRTFFVATLAEAKELRVFLSHDIAVMVLGGLFHDGVDSQDFSAQVSTICSDDWITYHITPVLFSVEQIARWAMFCASKQQEIPSVVKIDTGMHRLGLSLSDVDIVLKDKSLQAAHPMYIMSHFACADQPDHPLNRQQINDFARCADHIRQQIPTVKLSLSNSSGMFLGSAAHFDLCRPGAALYGINPVYPDNNPMKSVVSLKLPVMQVKTIEPGDAVGYGAEFVARKPSRLAIVFGGYADGLLRMLSDRGVAYCQGIQVPVAGRVSMDSMVFDVTEVDEKSVKPGMYIEVLGSDQTVDDLAMAAGTTGYEMLTNLGARYQRNYVYE